MVNFPDTVIFHIPGEVTYDDKDPVEAAGEDYSTDAEVQPGSNSVKVAVDGTQVVHAYDVFAPLESDIDKMKAATQITIYGRKFRMIQSYPTKEIISYEFQAGKSGV